MFEHTWREAVGSRRRAGPSGAGPADGSWAPAVWKVRQVRQASTCRREVRRGLSRASSGAVAGHPRAANGVGRSLSWPRPVNGPSSAWIAWSLAWPGVA